jgi:hypothetical protein
VKSEETSFARQQLGKQVSVATDTQTTIEELLGTMFPVCPCKIIIKKSSLENRSEVPSELLVESWVLQGRMRRWRYEFRCGVLTSGQRRDHGN